MEFLINVSYLSASRPAGLSTSTTANSVLPVVQDKALELSLTPFFLSYPRSIHQEILLALSSKYFQNLYSAATTLI